VLFFTNSVLAADHIVVRYHRTIETIMILRAISDSDYFFKRFPEDFKGRPMLYEARKYFKSYKDHIAVKETQKLLEESADIGGVLFQGVLYAEELPGTKLKHEPVLPFWMKNRTKLEAYMKVLAQFYKDADVAAFFDEYDHFYKGAIAEASGYMNDKVISAMESYFGASNDSYTLILLPLSPYGWGFSASVGKQQYALVSPVSNSEWKPVLSEYASFGFAGEGAKQHYRELVTHEFTHSFITAFLDAPAMRKQINSFDSLYIPALDSVMADQGYPDWWGFVNEHIVRLAEIRIAARLNKEDGNEMLAENVKESRFILLPDQQSLIADYETHRNKYKTIRDFLPVLVRDFSRFSKTDIDKRLRRAG